MLISKTIKKKKPGYQAEWERFGYAMISPSMIFLLLVTTIPLISLLVMSFFRIDLTYPMDNGWIGFENYVEVTEDARFWFSLKLTVIYTIITVFLQENCNDRIDNGQLQ